MSLLTNLVSYWKMDEASGNALDAHGTNPLTDTNTVGTGAGKIGTARDFELDFREQFVRASNSDFVTGDVDFAFQAWINVEVLFGFPTVLSKDDNSANREYGFYINASTGKVYFYVFGPAGQFSQVEGSGTIVAGTWYHLVGWHDAVNNVIGIAVNAGAAVTAAHSVGVRSGTADFVIGDRQDEGGQTFDGRIDEVGYWKGRILTAQERTDLYAGGAGLSYSSLGGAAATRLLGARRRVA